MCLAGALKCGRFGLDWYLFLRNTQGGGNFGRLSCGALVLQLGSPHRAVCSERVSDKEGTGPPFYSVGFTAPESFSCCLPDRQASGDTLVSCSTPCNSRKEVGTEEGEGLGEYQVSLNDSLTRAFVTVEPHFPIKGNR